MASRNEGYARPEWNYSPVCPDGYDYVRPWCKLKGYAGAPPDVPEPPRVPPEIILEQTKGLVGDISARVDVVTSKVDMALASTGLALLLAFAALIAANLKPLCRSFWRRSG
jgi:hypothetical protein